MLNTPAAAAIPITIAPDMNLLRLGQTHMQRRGEKQLPRETPVMVALAVEVVYRTKGKLVPFTGLSFCHL